MGNTVLQVVESVPGAASWAKLGYGPATHAPVTPSHQLPPPPPRWTATVTAVMGDEPLADPETWSEPLGFATVDSFAGDVMLVAGAATLLPPTAKSYTKPLPSVSRMLPSVSAAEATENDPVWY